MPNTRTDDTGRELPPFGCGENYYQSWLDNKLEGDEHPFIFHLESHGLPTLKALQCPTPIKWSETIFKQDS